MKRLILILFVVSIVNSFAQTKLDYGIQFLSWNLERSV